MTRLRGRENCSPQLVQICIFLPWSGIMNDHFHIPGKDKRPIRGARIAPDTQDET